MVAREDKLALAQFLRESREVLAEIVPRLDRLAPSADALGPEPSRQEEELRRAWQAFNEANDLQLTIDRLQAATQPTDVDDVELDELLESHGLYGPQLAFKIGLFRRHLEAFRRAVEDFDAQEPGVTSGWRRLWARLRGSAKEPAKQHAETH